MAKRKIKQPVETELKQTDRFKRKKGHEYLQGDKLEYGLVESNWEHPSEPNKVFILVKNQSLCPNSYTLYSMRTDCHCRATLVRFIPAQIMQ